jgi:hypothetical protein
MVAEAKRTAIPVFGWRINGSFRGRGVREERDRSAAHFFDVNGFIQFRTAAAR